ncbi:rhomboid domain-containing protein 3 [Tachysurus fulvidraco]|uniref:rhomboid domain-containing protein 3 n=1 Tax=Tachysurus fulvidraco TaxID=1234273 RepID=UPI000F511C50|nr:rhomboid domain-containing protein 3 [Tachysurus fulvidraco]XP_027024986.1 rhomboid domain-containing protein 3 [Tachysurus fulvidraco]XP_027024996.1 rhomboid domain-containing protein 3 [Tachysurus fulvidraco]
MFISQTGSMWSWLWCGLSRSGGSGVCSGTALILTLTLLVWLCGLHASLSLGPGGEVPGVYNFIFYAVSHEEFVSLLHDVVLLLYLGPRQERKWGTVVFLVLSLASTVLLPPIYALFLFVTGDEASRICGYSGTQLALLAAQCRQSKRRRVLRCLPPWSLPWLVLLVDLFLLPSAPGLLHFYAICLGLNYSTELIEVLQRLEGLGVCSCLPPWLYVSNKYQLPTYISPIQRSFPHAEFHTGGLASTSRSQLESHAHTQPWKHTTPEWPRQPVNASDEQLLDEELLRAGILASLQDAPEGTADKVEVQKSSVSSLRLQQLEKMGFPMEKAVLALAATPHLDGAISLLIDDQVGENAVVISKGKKASST